MIPKFYANLPDDNHCLQASILIVLNSLHHPISWVSINRLTKYDARYYSWTIFGATIISQRINGVKLITNLDYKKFADNGDSYLKSHWDNMWYESQKKHASPDFQREQQFAKDFVKNGKFELRDNKVSSDELSDLLKKNLILALINPYAIRGEDKTAGHFVVVFDDKDGNFIYHDPGVPPIQNASINHEIFLKALKSEILVIPRI